jgi:carotenoid cleavage dioxygenase-like enzyme
MLVDEVLVNQKVDVRIFRSFEKRANLSTTEVEIQQTWPENLSGHVFIIAPCHRQYDRHLFTGEGVIIRWDLKPEAGKIKVYSNKLKTWGNFWNLIQSPLTKLLPESFFPARLSLIGFAEIANTAIINMNNRLILTADAGRYWEVDPNSLETITPVGYFDEHIVSVPFSVFPLIANTAHPFYDPDTQELIGCELKSILRPGNFFTDMISLPYITCWDGEDKTKKKGIRHWEVAGTILDGSPHTTIVTEELIMIPDMPFQMGVAKMWGIEVPPYPAYPKTQLYLIKRQDLKPEESSVTSRLLTFDGNSYHFLCNYRHIESKIYCVAVQQATLSLTECIKPNDVRHFGGDRYTEEYYGIPWMFAFDPGVLRKVIIQDDQLMGQEIFIHPGWFTTMLYTADPTELDTPGGYSAIYQIYAGYHQDLICRRQYLSFRDHPNRLLIDEQLPKQDLPCVLAKIPLHRDWTELTEKIKTEQEQNPDTFVSDLGQELLDFYVCPPGYILDSIQFISQEQEEQDYIFATVLSSAGSQVWLFAAEHLAQGPIAKLVLPETINFGFTLHSEYFQEIIPRQSDYKVNRSLSALRSLVKVPYEFFFNRRRDILNRKVN